MGLSTELPVIFQRICERGERSRLFERGAAEWIAADPEFAGALQVLRAGTLGAETQLLLMLRTLAQHDALDGARGDGTLLVVTDPKLAGSDARFTGAVVSEMCAAARHEIFVAGYAFAAGSGLEDHLVAAAARGCAVKVVAGRWGDSKKGTGIDAILKAWPANVRRPECFVHKPSTTEIMHVKALIVDSDDMLVGSANFTYSAVSRNFELGVRVRGAAALHARRFLEAISASSDFERTA